MDYTIEEAAYIMGYDSTKTIRRKIDNDKKGKKDCGFTYRLIDGKYGPEYRIADVPSELIKRDIAEYHRKTAIVDSVSQEQWDKLESYVTLIVERLVEPLVDQRVDERIGQYEQRIRELESQVKQLPAPRQIKEDRPSWFMRLLGR